MGKLSEKTYTFEKSIALFSRATKVVPGGIYGHQSPVLTVPGSFPYFIQSAEGCRIRDVDGNEYIDFMCGYGPIVVGYNNPRVEEAATAQAREMNISNLPGPLWVELSERLVKQTPIADWVVYAKNGSDVTTWSLMVAREHTGKKKILKAKDTYHGTHAWCTPLPPGVMPEDLANVVSFNWNDMDDFHRKLKTVGDDLAGIITTPFRHEAFHASVLPQEGFFQELRKVCDERGAVLIMDDVRAALRLNLGGSNEYFNYKPDMICMSKAVANGYAISVCAGREELMNTASNVYFSGTYWTASPPLAAAMATLDELEEKNGVDTMFKIGRMLCSGLEECAQSHGLQISMSGPPSMPFMTFSNENDFRRNQVFAAETTKRGVFFHPHHNWFISTAHTEDDIKEALGVADTAFGIVKKQFGS